MQAIRSYLLMDCGHFADHFAASIFDRLHAQIAADPSGHAAAWLNPTDLDHALHVALTLSDLEKDPYTERLRVVVDKTVEPASAHTIEATDGIQLAYTVEWPLSVILTQEALLKYRRMFGFLLRNKRALYILRTIWSDFNGLNKNSNLVPPDKMRLHQDRLRKLQLFRREMQHFVTTLLNSIIAQLLEVSWKEFLDNVADVEDLAGLRDAHERYLDHAMTRCLLSDRATPVRNIVTSIYSLILKLRYQIMSSSLGEGILSDKAYQDMLRTWRSFRKHTHFLYIVLVKQVARTGDHYLQDLLLRLNYNYFYEREGSMAELEGI